MQIRTKYSVTKDNKIMEDDEGQSLTPCKPIAFKGFKLTESELAQESFFDDMAKGKYDDKFPELTLNKSIEPDGG